MQRANLKPIYEINISCCAGNLVQNLKQPDWGGGGSQPYNKVTVNTVLSSVMLL